MTQPDYDPDDNDVRDASITDTTRRGALAALGLGGLAALGSGHATADLAGGPESDAMSEYRVPYYRVPEPDLDSPGVVGRRVEITAGGATYETGDQLVDTGSSWERISAGVESLNTVEASIENWSQPIQFTIFKNGANIRVIDSNGSLGAGPYTDWGAAAQDAVDNLPETGETGAESTSAGGGRIHTTAGNYAQSTEVTVPGGSGTKFDSNWYPVQFSGEGAATTVKMSDGENLNAHVTFEIPASSVGHNHGITDIRFEGNKTNNTGGDAAIRTTDPHSGSKINQMRFENVSVLRFPGHGIDLSTKTNHPIIRGSLFEYCINAGIIGPDNGLDGARLYDIKSENNGTVGVDSAGVGSGIVSYRNGEQGMIVRAASNFENCRVETNAQDAQKPAVLMYAGSDFEGRVEGGGNTLYAVAFISTGIDSYCNVSARGAFANSVFNNTTGNYANQRNA